ncbi:MAG: response regulator transcription factor [Verrucomicrobia bacterium]|nr:response regulator transcription factor [Verrucomicrobiota bacterium]
MTNTGADSKIRILVVDDHILMRIGLISSLNKQPDMEVVGEAEDGVEAIKAYRSLRPDVVILDMRLPDKSGLEIIGLLKQEFDPVRILILSSYSGGHEISAAMQGGASAYVLKNMPLPRLLDSIRRVYAGEIVCLPEIARSLAGRQALNLSNRELEVLALISKGLSNKEVAAKLKLVEGTVKLHVSSILSKLGVMDRTQAILVAVKRGLVQLE